MSVSDFSIKYRVWIQGEGGTFLGEGRVVLLEQIQKSGSMNKAAKLMNMSYRKAWDLVDAMNREAEKPLVVKETGGKGGGGTRVTEEGERIIKMYKDLSKRTDSFFKKELKKLEF